MKKLKQILLADDDKANNFLNVCLLEEMGIAEQITVLLNGKQALEYLLASEAESRNSRILAFSKTNALSAIFLWC